MGIIRDIDELTPSMADLCRKFLSRCQDAGIRVAINETKRTDITQLLYFLQGNIDPVKHNKDIVNEYNRLRKKYGLWEVSVTDALNKQITWTLESNHAGGNAFDAVPIKDGKVWWNAPIEVWNQIGEIGESVGLKWGGRWEHKDFPHFELP